MSATETRQISLELKTEAHTQNLAAQIARYCKAGDCLLLQGDLGAGKTSFARAFIQAILPGTEVTSPTFSLVQIYDAENVTLWHFDLYRLKSTAELLEIGLEEALESGITLIEWPDIAQAFWPSNALTIHLRVTNDKRELTLSAPLPRWHDIMIDVKTDAAR